MTLGFTESKADSNLYYKVEEGNPVIILLYVDDLSVTGEDGLINMKRKCSGFATGCIPSSFWTAIKGIANFFVDIAHRLGEPHCICVSL